MKRLSENSVLDIKNRSFSVTASVDTAVGGPTNGVLIAQGGRFGGWALYMKDDRANSSTTCSELTSSSPNTTQALTAGSHEVRAEFSYDGGGLGKGGGVTRSTTGSRSAPGASR